MISLARLALVALLLLPTAPVAFDDPVDDALLGSEGPTEPLTIEPWDEPLPPEQQELMDRQTEQFTAGAGARSAIVVPKWQLPFERGQRWQSNGPHQDSDGTARGAVDFSPGTSTNRRVVSIAAGRVYRVTCPNGWFLGVDHGGGWKSEYYHLTNERASLIGEWVAAGTYLGDAASTLPCGGFSSGAHVHLSILYGTPPRPGTALRPYYPIDGMRFGNYTVHNGARAYQGAWRDLSGRTVITNAGCCLTSTTPASSPSGNSTFILRNGWSGQAQHVFTYGRRSDLAYIGDWNADGVDTPAVRRGRTFHFQNAQRGGSASMSYAFGHSTDEVLVGDWNGDGVDTLGVRRGNTYYLTNRPGAGSAEIVISYGRAGDEALVGDWDGDGADSLGVRRGSTFHLRNSVTNGPAHYTATYGRTSDLALVGDWNGDGRDTLGVRRGTTYYLTDRVDAGPAQRVVTYGWTTDDTLVGDWNGDGTDSLGVRRIG